MCSPPNQMNCQFADPHSACSIGFCRTLYMLLDPQWTWTLQRHSVQVSPRSPRPEESDQVCSLQAICCPEASPQSSPFSTLTGSHPELQP
uniref:CIPK21 n=1 Tax=Arundo donax TaxID=35708 RepID=A0A0A9BR19_ARUDO